MTTRRHTIRFAAVGLAMSGLMALAACGGDDSGDDTDTTAAVETTVADDTATTTATADTTATDDTASDDTTPATDDTATETTIDTSDVDALSAEECRALYEKFTSLGFDPTSDAEPEDLDAVFDEVADAVPDDLAGDIEVLRDAFRTLTEAEAEFGDDVTNPGYLEALQALDTPEFAQASARVEAYFANCEAAVAD